MRDKPRPVMQDGYSMSQAEAGVVLGLDQRTVSKAENSLLKKIRHRVLLSMV